MNQPPHGQAVQDEITLRDVILAFGDHARHVRRSYKLLAIFLILGGIYGLYRYWSADTKYTAECTFMVNEKEQNVGVTALLGEIGFLGSSDFKLEKIIELSKTRAMAEQVMFDSVNIDGKTDLLANHFIAELQSHDEWVEKPIIGDAGPIETFLFERSEVLNFDRLENKALIVMTKRLNERLTTSINDLSGILNFKFVATNEEVAYEVMNRLFEALSSYYTDKSVEKQQTTFNALSAKCDSLESVLASKEYQLADFRDTYRGQWLNVENTPADKLFREIKMLSIMYGEALKNKEVAAFSLANVRPFIQAIDRPIYPLKRNSPLWWLDLAIGLTIGLAVGVGVIILQKIYTDAMSAQ